MTKRVLKWMERRTNNARLAMHRARDTYEADGSLASFFRWSDAMGRYTRRCRWTLRLERWVYRKEDEDG